MTQKTKLLAFLFLATLLSCQQNLEVDVVIHNAVIYTVDGAFTTTEAMAIDSGVIRELGPEHQILNKYSAKKVIDARGRAVFPGLIDAHGHLVGYGKGLGKLDLVGTTSFENVLEKVDEYSQGNLNSWIIGRGWDQNDWVEKAFPNNILLSQRYPEVGVLLKRVDGHAVLVNDYLLQLAEIDSETEVAGGQIVKDANGHPTGVLIDAATELVENLVPEHSGEELMDALLRAQDSCMQFGLTSIAEPGIDLATVRCIQQAAKDETLKMRIYGMLSIDPSIVSFMEEGKIATERFQVQSVKVYCDGALGSRGALLKEPYNDHPMHSGISIVGRDSLDYWARLCKKHGYQMNVHCIGDLANSMTLEVMDRVLGGTNDLRWRIEHAQVVDPSDLHYFSDNTIIPSVQPTHAISDMPWMADRLGSDRKPHAYAYASLLAQNGLIALGTDFPVESPSPAMTFYTAVERKNASGEPDGGFLPEEALTREQALRGMTIWAAIANFQDEQVGSLEVGKKADIVILDRDWMHCEASIIPETKVILTMINGEVVYEIP